MRPPDPAAAGPRKQNPLGWHDPGPALRFHAPDPPPGHPPQIQIPTQTQKTQTQKTQTMKTRTMTLILLLMTVPWTVTQGQQPGQIPDTRIRVHVWSFQDDPPTAVLCSRLRDRIEGTFRYTVVRSKEECDLHIIVCMSAYSDKREYRVWTILYTTPEDKLLSYQGLGIDSFDEIDIIALRIVDGIDKI
jgi:hypothetical protein